MLEKRRKELWLREELLKVELLEKVELPLGREKEDNGRSLLCWWDITEERRGGDLIK